MFYISKKFQRIKISFNSISDNSFIFFCSQNYSIFFYESQNNLNSNYFKLKINDVINFLNLEETKVDIKTKNKNYNEQKQLFSNEQKQFFSRNFLIHDNYYFPEDIIEKKKKNMLN